MNRAQRMFLTCLCAGICVLAAASAVVAGRLVARVGRRLTVAGLTVVVAGLVMTALALRYVEGDAAAWAAAGPLLLGGIGGGMVTSPNITLALESVPVRMAGVAGHAGLFTTAADLARFARMMLGLGELDGARVFQPETVQLMTSVQTPPTLTTRRGLGWDIDSSYSGPRGEKFPVGSYGHTGWTGGSLWIDPASQTFVIFLSNRNHPTSAGNVIALRRKLGTLAAESLIGVEFPAGNIR